MATTQSATTWTAAHEVDEHGWDAPAPGSGVVVGHDGSEGSTRALAWAAEEAARRGAALTVLHALDAGGDAEGVMVRGAGLYAREQGRTLLADALEELERGREARWDVRPALSSLGPVEALVRASVEADLLVVGSRGRGSVRSALLGSVAYSVLARASCPVVVVRGEDGLRPGPGRPVVLGVAGGEPVGPAVAFAARAAQRDGAGLRVVSAWDRPETVMAVPFVDDVVRHARSQGAQAVSRARGAASGACPDLEVSVETVEGRAPQVLAAASARAGLLVVGARGLGRIGGLFLGSVSHEAVHLAPCPVAVVRSGVPRPRRAPWPPGSPPAPAPPG